MISRRSGRPAALIAAVLIALTGTLLVPAPAQAARSWQTVYETVRHVKAQMCRTNNFTNDQGLELKALRWRSNAVQAGLGGSVQLFTDSDRFEDWYSDWVWASAGSVSAATKTNFLAVEQVRIKMRVKTRNGTTAWSPAYRFIDIRHC